MSELSLSDFMIRHDAWLDNDKNAHVYAMGKKIIIEREQDWTEDIVLLDASQALSLLTWLEQERTTLEQMAMGSTPHD